MMIPPLVGGMVRCAPPETMLKSPLSQSLHCLFRNPVFFRKIGHLFVMRCIDYANRVTDPTPETLNPGNNGHVFIPSGLGDNSPHHFGLVENVDVTVNNDGKLQVGLFGKGNHGSHRHIPVCLLVHGNVSREAPHGRMGKWTAVTSDTIFFIAQYTLPSLGSPPRIMCSA